MSANEKKPAGFFLYPEHVRAACAMLSAADAGRLLIALCDYAETGALPATPRKAFQACFSLLQGDIDRDADRYREICERNRELANRRWHSNPPAEHADACHGMPTHADACHRMPTQHNPTQPNTTQPNTTQPNTTQPNPAQPSTAPPAAASAAPGAYSRTTTKGVHHGPSANSPRHRGTTL